MAETDVPVHYLTTTNCRELQSAREHVVQLNEDTLATEFDRTDEDEYVILERATELLTPNPRLPARVETKATEVGKEEIGVGTNLHQALGMPLGKNVRVIEDSTDPYGDEPVNRILQTRPALCRVRRAVLPDPEFRVCRLPASVMSLIGIEEGDMVVLESGYGRSRVRALPLTDDLREKKRRMEEQHPERYAGEIAAEPPLGADIDIPPIYIDYDTRTELGIEGSDTSGTFHPVRVYRDNRSVLLALLDDLAIPVFALLVSIILMVGGFLSFHQALAVVAMLLALVILFMSLQAIFRARRAI